MKILVFDVGGTSIKYGVCVDGQLEYVKEVPTNAKKGGSYILETLISLAQQESDYDAIGVSTAGQVHSKDGYIIYANQNIPGYTGIQIGKTLEERFQVPVAVENDVNSAAIGEASFGSGKDYHDFIMLTYGTGVGGAFVSSKEIYYGAGYCASEFGAIITHSDVRLAGNDYFDGCYEKYASTTGLVKMAMEYDSSLCSGREIFSRIHDPNILNILDRWIDEIWLGLASLIHIYNPSCVILGGGIMEQPLILQKLLEKKDFFIMPSFSNVDILRASLGNKAGLLGAYYQASKKLNKLS